MKRIYADNAATTALDDRAFEAMLPFLKEQYGNPSSHHFIGREAKRAIEKARKDIAGYFGEGDVYFTSGGSESNNWAIKALAKLMISSGKSHIITSAFEHHSVLNCCKELEREGFTVTYIKPDKDGIISPADVENAIGSNTGLVSIMYVNNELGTLQPIQEISKICRNNGVLFHTDAIQAVGKITLDAKAADLISFSAHKFHGPKGIGGLFVRKGLTLPSFIAGGNQEYGKRAGTENVAGIVAMAEALKNITNDCNVRKLTEKLITGLTEISGTHLNGSPCTDTGIVNIRFDGIDSESLMLMLDLKGICVSAGAACTTGNRESSHVLKAIGLSDKEAQSCVRFSLSRYNTENEIDEIISVTGNIAEQLRKM